MKANSYESSDSLWGRITDYGSAVWESWGKDTDSYVDNVMQTDARSDDELFVSTALQDAGHNVALAWHLLGSVVSNDYTQERAKELGTALSQTQGYSSAKETIAELEEAMHEAKIQFMQEHPKVGAYLEEIGEDAQKAIGYIQEEAKAFAHNHPEISHDFQALVEVASSVPAVKGGKIALGATEEVQIVEKLQYLDKAHKHPIEIRTPTPEDLDLWQEITEEDKGAPPWIWNNSLGEGLKEAVQTKSLESLKSDIGVQAGLSKVLRQKPEFVQISTEGKPLGMMLMVKDYKNHISEENSGFVWYLQSAPKDYMKDKLDIDRDEFVIKPGAALLDTAAVNSLGAGRNDVMLHADPAGGNKLMDYYAKQKYEQVGQDKASNITGLGTLGRDNDGRYFHQEHANAEAYMKHNREAIGQAYEIQREVTPHHLNKTDMALGTAATVAIANEGSQDEDTIEFDANGMVILPDSYTVSVDEIKLLDQEEPFDSNAKAQEILERTMPHIFASQNQQSNEMNDGIEL